MYVCKLCACVHMVCMCVCMCVMFICVCLCAHVCVYVCAQCVYVISVCAHSGSGGPLSEQGLGLIFLPGVCIRAYYCLRS